MSSNLPLITIITVVYNAALAIEETIQCVINLPYPNINYIIIDGGSKDGTIDVIKKYESNLTYWTSEPDRGIYDAMNKGWAKACEDSYILFLGAGDRIISLPGMSYRQSADIIYGNVQIGKNGIFHASADIRLRLGNTIHHQALLIKKKVHPTPPFSIDYPTYGDFDFNQKLLKTGKKFIRDKNFLSYAIEGGVSEAFKPGEALKIVRKNYGNFWVLVAKMYYFFQKVFHYYNSRGNK